MIDYKVLEQNLVDLMKEEQAKLGYRKESIRFYYPLSSLNHFFKSNASAEEMQEILDGLPDQMRKKYGDIQCSHKGDRFCVTLPEKASEYVHMHMEENEFIRQLVELIAKHDTTMQQIFELFESQKDECVIKHIDKDEFDVLIYFKGEKDPYYYCLKDEGCHIIYHRFLPEDYEDLWR